MHLLGCPFKAHSCFLRLGVKQTRSALPAGAFPESSPPIAPSKGQMVSPAKLLEEQVAVWPQVSVAPHRFGGREFRLQKAEIGHVHFWGDVDIPFPRAIHDILIADGLAQRHRWLPDSGWITFHMAGPDGIDHALWLLRLSYLRYMLKTAPDPSLTLQHEAQRLNLGEKLVAVLAQFIPSHVCPN